MTITSLPPQAVDAEYAIIGSVLFDPNALGKIVDSLTPYAFYNRANKIIFDICLELHRRNQPTDLLTVSQALEDHKLLSAVGGEAYLIRAVDSTVSAVNIDQYAKLVNEKWIRRQLIDIGYQIIEMGHDPTVEIEESLGEAQSLIFNLKLDKPGDRQMTLDEGWDNLIYEIENPETLPKPIGTGIDSYDDMTGGLRPGELIIVAGRASMGKSWLGNHLALSVAKTGKPVLFFSAEMEKRKLIDRFICTLSRIDLQNIINRRMNSRALAMLFDAYTDNYGKFLVTIDDTNGSKLTMDYIIRQCQLLAMKTKEIGAVVVDYIQLIGQPEKENRAQALGAIAQGFKELAKEFECPVIALAQINRGVEGRQDKRPSMADIKDSGGIEQAADVVAALYRDNYYNPESGSDELEIIVTKNRNGPTGTAKCIFVPESGLFCNSRAELNRMEAELLNKYPF